RKYGPMTRWLVTGAAGMLGRDLTDLLQARGEEFTPMARTDLDITDPAAVAAAAATAEDVTLLVNNAGVATYQNLVTGDIDKIRLEMETHYFGTLNMVRAFAPVLARNSGGSILNVMSLLSWLSYDGATAYSAAKAAEWSLTNGIRLELAGQGTTVTGLHLGSTDTDMMAGFDVEKNDPADVVRTALDGLEAGEI
ncbi:MAG TPA: SDR family NAD(P)-dependent oxidoreductase, partial [Streptosporangiaceae bacterium]|nr:SDR family NAD(P)-dependent oxidoreductase [Streptosporangiaceae bacterium]